MPEVSVIIPCYNHGHYLGHALHSVLAQIYTDWEAIVVDDGSTDDTAAVAASITDPRIRYIYQEHQGLSAARNTGIGEAQGEYLGFLDADDEWEPEFLARCVGVLQQDDSLGFVYTRAVLVDLQGTYYPQLEGQALAPQEFLQQLEKGGFFPVHAVLVRREVLAAIGRFDTDLTSVEDWDLWLRISKHYRVRSIDEPLARYRVYPGSMSTHVACMHANRIAVLTKQFGPPEEDMAGWPIEKRRAYAFAYRTTAISYITQREADEGWGYLLQAAETYPGILTSLDTFYELACGDQPRGLRGQAALLDLEANGAEMLRRLGALFAAASRGSQGVRGAAYGNAYLALAMLSDQAGDWAGARRYLLRAIRTCPRLSATRGVVRRLLKLCLGKRVVRAVRSLRWGRAEEY
jgi:glycosyltransferase involved in cell wall biosynthesis